ncbi:hypothetical protein GT50_01275 [Geobacillus stearothermophilus 10]|nr:hypothetical protein GT50_01275 [Geobacillus stearothermophilus 10]
MAKTDRGVLVSNNQEFGMIADPNKLEASITHAYDIIDQNDDELIAHKSSGDHDGRYYTKTQLDNGQLDNRYYTETELNNGALDGRYYTESEVDTKTTNLQNQINTHKTSADHDTRYYTKTQLDGGQLDNRYYTETEIDTKVNNLQSQITTNTNDINTHKTSGDHDTRYYTKTQLDNGQLDNRYYTKAELSGSGGASNLGITPIVGLTASNTQQALEGLNNKINQTALGQIPDGSITPQKLSFSPMMSSEKGAPNGVATLDGSGKALVSQLPSASTTQAGIVQLNDTLTSTSTTQAATANAVKQVNDAVVAHLADTTKHITSTERTNWNTAKSKSDDLEILYWMGAI